jgi:hypothetical protein
MEKLSPRSSLGSRTRFTTQNRLVFASTLSILRLSAAPLLVSAPSISAPVTAIRSIFSRSESANATKLLALSSGETNIRALIRTSSSAGSKLTSTSIESMQYVSR